MPLALSILFQATEIVVLDGALSFDLRRLPRREGCQRDAVGEILVCGRTGEGDRLTLVEDERFEAKPLRAEMAIGPAQGSAYVEQKDFPGAISQRMMVKLKLPF